MNNKSDICFFLPEVAGGGAERVVCELSAYFSDAGKKVTLMLLQDRRRDYAVNPNVNIVVLPTANSTIKKKIVMVCMVAK